MPETEKKALSRLVITCGGTGGHFYPGLSIAVAAQQRGIEVRLLLSGVNAAVQSAIAEKAGIDTVVLPTMPHPGSLSGTWRFARGATGGLTKSLRHLRKFAPHAVLGMGSFAMTPVILAAKMHGIPVFLHDGNTVIGKANRMFSRIARAVGCAYPPVNAAGIRAPWELVGMPVRQALRQQAAITKHDAVAELNRHFPAEFVVDTPTVLVIGGSQGAASFNTILPETFKKLSSPLQVMHLSGRGKREDTAAAYDGFGGKLLLLESSEHIEWFLGAADLVFTRSGGSTLAELTLFGKPAVLIPYPYAAENHQRHNAEWFAEIGGGKVIDNADLSPDRALEMLRIPLEQWQLCAAASLAAARPDAAEKMLDLIENHIQ
jgi:UDP-N-acetylglucosamine--N-acetylmuramyl-(pentapeptide) pyrophosphoryl-undecaprenol N-acetylglucosamine transferase